MVEIFIRYEGRYEELKKRQKQKKRNQANTLNRALKVNSHCGINSELLFPINFSIFNSMDWEKLKGWVCSELEQID